MFLISSNASDDDLLDAVITWFNLIASGDYQAAQDFLYDGPQALSVGHFIARVEQMTKGGGITAATRIENEWDDVTNLPVLREENPTGLVCRWAPGPKSTGKFPGFIGDILHPIPVDGTWSDLDASFYIRDLNENLALELRDVIRLED